MNLLPDLPAVWAQATASPSAASALLALRRWCASLSLSSPVAMPRPYALWAWLGGMGALLFLAVLLQGPKTALRQLLDLPGHARLVASALGRLRRAGRLVAVTCGVTVVVWTANQTVSYSNVQGTEDLDVLLRSKTLGEFAVEQGIFAALTPMRDVFGMGDTLPLLVVAAALVFRVSADRWGGLVTPTTETQSALSGWTTVCWGGAWLYALYRFAAMVDTGDLPLGGCLIFEAGIVPVLMVLADSLILAWVLVELRNAGLGSAGGEPLDVNGAIALVPASVLACLLALPARYLATGGLLAMLHVPAYVNGVPLFAYQRLAWSLVAVQGAALVTVGLAGAVPWSRGNFRGALRGFGRLLAREGGRLVATLCLGGAAAGAVTATAYLLVLAMPRQPWVLGAADSYAHYATLPVGLATLAALVELGERCLPLAKLAQTPSSGT